MSKVSILKPQVGKVFFKQTPSRQSVISPKNKIVFLKKKKKSNDKSKTIYGYAWNIFIRSKLI